jgi:predicted DNA-binding transcriptional regulator AlpA
MANQLIEPIGMLGEAALIDAKGVAAAGCMSISKWYELVRSGEAPQPVIRRQRFTRWRVVDIRAFLLSLATNGCEERTTAAVIAKAKKASATAKAKRAALQSAGA